jgi:hypothetical protein
MYKELQVLDLGEFGKVGEGLVRSKRIGPYSSPWRPKAEIDPKIDGILSRRGI